MVCLCASATVPPVPEPEFINSQIHLTSDSTFNALPREEGKFKKHESKVSKFGFAAIAVGTIGGTMIRGGSVNRALNSLMAMSAV